jgi:hypothetical protein
LFEEFFPEFEVPRVKCLTEALVRVLDCLKVNLLDYVGASVKTEVGFNDFC